MGKRWTIKDVEKLAEKGKVKLGDGFFPEKKKNQSPLPVSELKLTPEGLKHIDTILSVKKIDFVKEYVFAPGERKFRADRYIPSLNLLIEYEGIYSEKSRHTFYKGYSEDAVKYNLATVHGYKLLRFTADNYRTFSDLLTRIMDMNAD